MGDQHQRGAQLFIERKHQLHHGFTRGKVQATGGLIGQQNRRLHDESPGQRHALLFAAGQHLGVMVQPLAQPHPLEHVGGLGTGAFDARQLQRQHDVFKSR